MVKLNNSTPAAIILSVLLLIWLLTCTLRIGVLIAKHWKAINESQSGMYSLPQSFSVLADILLFVTALVVFYAFFKQNVVDES